MANDVKLKKVTREDIVPKGIAMNNFSPNIGLGNLGATNVYPNDLEKEKTVAIHVYDTSKYEKIYSGLIDTTQNVASGMLSTFASAGSGIANALTGVANQFTSSLEKAPGGFFSSGEGSTGTFKNFTSSMSGIDLTPGNMKLSKKYHETFYLPVPNELQEQISNGYEDKPGWINDMPGMGAVKGFIDDKTTGEGMSMATWSKLTGARSIQYYENRIQMYTSSEFREITLTWDLVPNNAAESNQIQEIVRKIKMYGSPETAAGKLILKSPCFFGIEFFNPTLDSALQFCEVVLISATIDYVPGGNMEMYKDNMPKHIQLSMTFRDREPKLRENWENRQRCSQNSESSNDQNCQVSSMPGSSTPAPTNKGQ